MAESYRGTARITINTELRNWVLLMAAWLFCVSFAAGAHTTARAAAEAPSTSSAVSGDLFPDKARLRFARCFTLEYHGTYKRLEVLTPWRNARDSFLFILVPRGHSPPSGLPRGTAVIPVPVERMALFSTTWTSFFSMLHIEEALVGIAGCELIGTPEVASLIQQGRIVEIGDGGQNMNRQINMERLTLLKPEAVMVYGTGIPEFDQGPKLLEAGFKPLINASHMEATPLGRTEWIKFIAAFFNKEAEAERVFDEIALRYEALTEKTRTVSRRPTVFCNAAWRGTWYMPGGAGYTARFLADAGADYLWREDTTPGSTPLAIETVVDRARDAEFWVDTNLCRSLSELRGIDDRFRLFSSFRTGKVFNNDARINARGGNDFWETGLARPDLVLADLISIFHPELLPDHRRLWYRQLPAVTEGEQ